jgi:hypothetical protein
MKKLVTLVFVLVFNGLSAQEFSYGPVVGMTIGGVANSSGVVSFGFEKSPYVSLGAYGEYNFTKNVGIKTELLFNKRDMSLRITNAPGVKIGHEFSFFEVNPSFKYDFGQEYRKGFYMLLGPRFSFATKISSGGEDVKDEYETFLYGVQLGFGSRVYKYVDVQTKIEYDITSFADFDNDRKSNFFGAVISLNLDVERLIKSN